MSFFSAFIASKPVGDSAGNYKERVANAQAQSFLEGGVAASVSAFVVALGFGVICYLELKNPVVLWWLLGLNSLQAVRFLGVVYYRRNSSILNDPIKMARWYAGALFMASLGWGLSPWLFIPNDNLPLVALCMLILLGVGSASIASTANFLPAAYLFQIPMMLLLIASLLRQSSYQQVLLAFFTAIYAVTHLRFARTQNLLLTKALEMRFSKEELAQRLSLQMSEMERLSEQKTRFFAAASHDLRQPLHSLGLFCSALQRKLGDDPHAPLVIDMQNCIKALSASCSAMLDVSKLDAGVVQAVAEPVSLSQVFKNLYVNFALPAENQSLTLRFLPAGRWVISDAQLLERLLGNLIHNAIKFTKTGGVMVTARQRGEHVLIQVWDSGCGVASSEQEKIFEEFYQVGNQERDRSQGLGIGLAIVQRLAKVMGAEVVLKSRLSRGSVFSLSLRSCSAPLPQEDQRLPIQDSPSAILAGKQVLILDDEFIVRRSTALILSSHGVRVIEASDIEQASAMALQLSVPLDALITDLRLAEKDNGLQGIARIRALVGFNLPCIIMTGDTSPERVAYAHTSGVQVLYKPVSQEALLKALGSCFTAC